MNRSENNETNIVYNKKLFIIVLLLIIIIIKHYIISSSHHEQANPTNVPEISYFFNQSLQLYAPKKDTCLMTLYFSSEYRNNDVANEYAIFKKILKDKNYFVTFYSDNPVYEQYSDLFKKYGLIRSSNKHGNNNIAISLNINFILEYRNLTHEYYLNKHQKFNIYLNGEYLFQKNTLYNYYKSMKQSFYDDFNYMPETYIYPEDKKLIEEKFKGYILNMSDLWLVKPTNLCAGIGVKILNSLKNISLNEYIITKYIKNVSLINGKKYDLRLYALISCLKPLRIYLYKEGLVRISSEKYSLNLTLSNNKYVHLTNIDVNKNNKNFITPNKINNTNANEWNLDMYKAFLKKENIEWMILYEKIKDIIIKSIISVYQELLKGVEENNFNDQNFYEILGVDILITDDVIPVLMEINYSPQMASHNNLDNPIKTNLLTDTLNLIGISPYSRKSHKPLNLNHRFHNEIEDNINNALCELNRPRGDYELIFPNKENIYKYKKYFINNNDENEEFWEKIIHL